MIVAHAFFRRGEPRHSSDCLRRRCSLMDVIQTKKSVQPSRNRESPVAAVTGAPIVRRLVNDRKMGYCAASFDHGPGLLRRGRGTQSRDGRWLLIGVLGPVSLTFSAPEVTEGRSKRRPVGLIRGGLEVLGPGRIGSSTLGARRSLARTVAVITSKVAKKTNVQDTRFVITVGRKVNIRSAVVRPASGGTHRSFQLREQYLGRPGAHSGPS